MRLVSKGMELNLNSFIKTMLIRRLSFYGLFNLYVWKIPSGIFDLPTGDISFTFLYR